LSSRRWCHAPAQSAQPRTSLENTGSRSFADRGIPCCRSHHRCADIDLRSASFVANKAARIFSDNPRALEPNDRVMLQRAMASLSLKSGALTDLRTPAASRGMLSARPESICNFDPHSLAPNAATRPSRRCRPMPASSSMTAKAVANGSSPSRAIAACSALTAQCRARRYRATCVAACRKSIKSPEALKARSRPGSGPHGHRYAPD
jgi:hypothetical protein